MSMFTTPQWEMGQKGEKFVAIWLQENGLGVINLTKISGEGAPSLNEKESRTVLPDLQASGAGKTGYVEVKTKTQPAPNPRDHFLEHGIELRLLNAYRRIAQTSGLPVFLCIVEVDSGAILIADTAKLKAREFQSPHSFDGKPMAFFRRHDFEIFTPPAPPDIKPIETAKTRGQLKARPQSPGIVQKKFGWGA